ncbi:MAG: papain-like cysteine protease family protein [Granulosicoccus sp.]
MEIIRNRSRSPQVKLAQRLANNRIPPSPKLTEDSIFGSKTEVAIKQFQVAKRLTADGIVGPITWRSLGVTIDVSHRIVPYAQPTNMTCWSAAATMLLGSNMCVGPGSASTGPMGGLNPSFANIEAFANSYNLRMHAPQSWSTPGLVNLMRRGPIWVAGWVPSGHAVVYAGIHGDNTPGGTLIVIYDPWPPGRGGIRGEIYGDWLRKHPTAATYILQK